MSVVASNTSREQRSRKGGGNKAKSLAIVGESQGDVRSRGGERLEPTGRVPYRGNVALVTLGCAKNHVDSEVMLGVLAQGGFQVVDDLIDADVAVVNTCGFLQSAVDESVAAIKRAATFKRRGRLRRLIVAGCMVERYGDELTRKIDGVDAYITTGELLKVADIAGRKVTDNNFVDPNVAEAVVEEVPIHPVAEGGRPYFLYDDSSPRMLATKPYTAFVKVSEGCNRPCAFCIIPRIRGDLRSRQIGSVVREVQSLVEQGVQEVNLVAQDLTAFGSDTKEGTLADLLVALCEQTTVRWIRLHYAYPLGVDSRLLEVMASFKQICPYLDIPLQHVSEDILRAMRRPLGKFAPRKIVDFIKGAVPQLHIRSTFIVGFPGETEAHAQELAKFVGEGWFSHVGVFAYSREEGTPSYEMSGQVLEKHKLRRQRSVMTAQQRVVDERYGKLVGSVVDMMLEGAHRESPDLLVGRASFQAPEVDGNVVINRVEFEEQEAPQGVELVPGRIYRVRISKVLGYDLLGTIVGVG